MRKHPLPGKMITITLPWPPAVLNPNQRAHWSKKDKARAKYRGDCWMLTKSFMHMNATTLPEGNHPLTVMFHPPSTKSRDIDNLLASCKAAIDGVAEALNVDDKRFRPLTCDMAEPFKGGKVVLTVGAV